jgi:hypothetical protein
MSIAGSQDRGCKIGDKVVRFDDLTPQAWEEVGRAASHGEWARVYVAPMADLSGALALVCECVKVATPNEGEPMAKALELGSSLGKLDKLFVDVVDDKPSQWTDGVPDPKADEGSTTS